MILRYVQLPRRTPLRSRAWRTWSACARCRRRIHLRTVRALRTLSPAARCRQPPESGRSQPAGNDDWYDDDPHGGYEPDETDYELARPCAEFGQHCAGKHGGGECRCRPPLRNRICWRALSLRRAIRTRLKRTRQFDEPPF